MHYVENDVTYFWTTAQASISKAFQDGNLKIAIKNDEYEVESLYFDDNGKIAIRLKI